MPLQLRLVLVDLRWQRRLVVVAEQAEERRAEILGEVDPPSRALALRLLDGVVPQQRWGVPAGTDPTDAVGVKNGWYPGDEGWRVNSVGVVRPADRPTYAVAVMTGSRPTWREGIGTIEGIAERINAAQRVRR